MGLSLDVPVEKDIYINTEADALNIDQHVRCPVREEDYSVLQTNSKVSRNGYSARDMENQ